MLSRQFHRHLMVATDADLAAEIQTTTDPEAHDALSSTIREREDYHHAIDLIGAFR
ncbi:hypothetical protein SEA_JFLIX2_45 [Rhodococcus phage Jflix2]|nr:hypothetical protein SEA_JFLIX2_45 [Rhodococcus phage Jflix2]